MDHPDRVVQDEEASPRGAEEGPCESVVVRWRWELAMMEVGLQWGVEYHEGKDAKGVHKRGSHTSPAVVGAQGGQLGPWSRGPGDGRGWVATKTLEQTRQGRSGGHRQGDRPYKTSLRGCMKCGGGLLLFGTSDFTPCPVVLECLERAGTNTLVDPAVVENDFALLTGILAEQVLTRLFVGVN